MGANPNANGGLLLKELNLPDFREYGIKMNEHGKILAQDMIKHLDEMQAIVNQYCK